MCEGETIHERDLPPELIKGAAGLPRHAPLSPAAHVRGRDHVAANGVSSPSASRRRVVSPSIGEIEAALEKSRYHRGEAARLLGVSRTTLWRRMRELEML